MPGENNGTKNEVSLLGLPAGDKWVLYAPWGDKPMTRNMLCMNLTRQLGSGWAPNGVLVEVVLSSFIRPGTWSYAGVYYLMEKIDRGKHRVPIAKLEPSDNTAPDLTGGYIIKIDKVHPGEVLFNFTLPSGVRMLAHYPASEDITPAQGAYIAEYMTSFERALNSSSDVFAAVSQLISVESFIDYFLVQEAFFNQDGFLYSTYFYKDRMGLLQAGPTWDMDLTFANLYAPIPVDWQFEKPGVAYWWGRLLQDEQYRAAVLMRWQILRAPGGPFTNESLWAVLGAMTDAVYYADDVPNSPASRNYAQYDILDVWQWPGLKGAQYLHDTYPPYVVDGFTYWWPQRLVWMDARLPLLLERYASMS